ncbi:MAG: lipocalin family protein [Prevotella sp.]|nr:lipocalin family protein [Prevotella sp.]
MKKTMKVMVILLCAVTMAMTASCSKESRNERRIVGRWQLTSQTTYYYDALNTLVKFEENPFGELGILEFTAGGDFIELGLYSCPYTLDGDNLILGNNDGENCEIFTIEELTTTTMVLSERGSWMGGETYAITRMELRKINE